MAEQKAKTADRKKVQVVQEIPCQRCGKPTRVVRLANGMWAPAEAEIILEGVEAGILLGFFGNKKE